LPLPPRARAWNGWPGHQQLASQLLARLSDDDSPVAEHLRVQAKHWLHQAGGATPLCASLLAHDALLRTLPVGSSVNALVTLPDGRLASGSDDNTIGLWDPHTGSS
jgi:WD40 repeat protein